LRCPRCHELFPYRAGAEAGGQAHPEHSDPGEIESPLGERVDRVPLPRWSNRAVATIILSVMGVMAAIGLAFAWFTTENRRQRDHLGQTSAPSSPPVSAVAPAKLAGLGYLPEGTEAIIGIHVAELMAQPDSRSILRLMREDRVNFGVYRLEEVTGLRLEDLDHIVLGVHGLRAFLVVQTRRPYDPEEIRENLEVSTSIQRGHRMLYTFPLEQTLFKGTLWCASERTLVFALRPADLDAVPDKPTTDLERFPTPVQEYLRKELREGTPVWVAGFSNKWDDILGLLLLGLPDADRQIVMQVNAFCGWLRCNDRKLTGRVDVRCSDAAGAENLDRYLEGLNTLQLPKMAQKWPRAAALAKELVQSLKRFRKGERVVVNLEADTDSIRQLWPQPAPGSRAAK
jgi:hypothetical protein